MLLKTTGEVVKNYQEYFSSQHWDNLKKKLKNKFNRCWNCNNRFEDDWNVIGHHKNLSAYRKLGNEKVGKDVVAVCQACHSHNSLAHRKLHKFGVPPWEKIDVIKKRNIMKWIKRLLLCSTLIGLFICGMAITNWSVFRKFTDKVGLTNPQQVIIQEFIDYDMEIIENDDGSISIIIRAKGE